MKRRIVAMIRTYPKSFVWVISDRYVAGIPDIVGSLNGRLLAIEVKTPKGRLSALQKLTLERLKKTGAIVGVARSVEDARAIISQAMASESS